MRGNACQQESKSATCGVPTRGLPHGTVSHGDIADGPSALGGSTILSPMLPTTPLAPSVTTVKLEPYKLLVQDQSHYSSGGGNRLLGFRFKKRSLRRDTRAWHAADALVPLTMLLKSIFYH